MAQITLTKLNIYDSLISLKPTYFVIEDVVELDEDIVFPKGSVLDFRGGGFKSDTEKIIRHVVLNGSTVRAASYCIFNKDISVSGFGNSFIKSEWFKDAASDEHDAINRSLTAANGVPVHLEGRTYELTAPIRFPECKFHQTLISPGTLLIHNDLTAIEVNQSHITLDINRIQFSVDDTTKRPEGIDPNIPLRFGTGILLTDSASYVDINVNIISGLHKSIAVIPGIVWNTKESSPIQFCTIRFKMIQYTTYCFYVDIFSKSGLPAGSALGTRFSDSRVIGGRMMGENAIYFVNPDKNGSGETYPDHSESITRLLFENIGLEDLTGIPMYINHVSSSKFLNLRHAESLPGMRDGKWNHSVKWFILNHVSGVTISSKGLLDPMRIDARKDVRNVIFDAFVLDDFGWYINHYDRVAINTGIDGNPQMVVTSSVQPYNMAKTFSYKRKLGEIVKLIPLTINDLFPQVEPQSGTQAIKVLPRTLNMIVKKGENIDIDLTAIDRFGQCIIDIFATVETGGYLMFSISNYPPRKHITVVENGSEYDTASVTFIESALYRLTFDANWNIVITKITL